MKYVIWEWFDVINYDVILHYISLPVIDCTFQNSALFKNNKNTKKLLVFGEKGSRRLSNFS